MLPQVWMQLRLCAGALQRRLPFVLLLHFAAPCCLVGPTEHQATRSERRVQSQ